MSDAEGRLLHFTPGQPSAIGQYIFFVAGTVTSGANVSISVAPPVPIKVLNTVTLLSTAHSGTGKFKVDILADGSTIYTGTASGLQPIVGSGVTNQVDTLSSPINVSAGKALTMNISGGSAVAAGLSFALRITPA